jgi:penicillin-binding protein 1A
MKINRSKIILGMCVFTIACALLIGLGLGSTFAGVINTNAQDDFGTVKMAEASKVYDIKGRLITELFGEEKREIVSIYDMPPFLIQAVLTREDREFYHHGGINVGRTFLAVFNNLLGRGRQGASTITQQLAGLLYSDRNEKTIFRKITELYFALQLEKKLSKDEILELYLNQMYFGHGCYGVEAASQYHFGHSVKNLTPAEAAMLVIQLANWNIYSPRKDPARARKMQENVLTDMVALGYISQEEASTSFDEFWRTFDITRSGMSAFQGKLNLAPYFADYVEQKIVELLYNNTDIYRDGLEIYTTLNIDFQRQADALMKERLEKVNVDYAKEIRTRSSDGETLFLPALDLLSLNYNLPHLHVDRARHMVDTIDYYAQELNPTLDMAASLFGFPKPKEIAKKTYEWQQKRSKTTQVQGALISIDPYTGYIYAMVGGKEFSAENRNNYATNGFLQPGSAFKPLFYAEAIEEKTITPSTILNDVQMYFQEPSGKIYIPNNYGEQFRGEIPARMALAASLNIPAINVLQSIGFDSAISMSSRLLGVDNPDEVQRRFPRVWSLALGVINTSPLSMARAFSTFVNGGKGIEPIGILYIKDRSGRIIAEPEKERNNRINAAGGLPQLMKPQTAYLMLSMLETAVKSGTLTFAKNSLGDIRYPVAGKTGTTQNWKDAWTVGFSPYLTTAVWFGFDKGGGSLGTNRTGAVLASPIWGKFMHDVHEQMDADRAQLLSVKKTLEKRSGNLNREVGLEEIAQELNIPSRWLSVIEEEHAFIRPPGLADAMVCNKSGLKPSPFCQHTTIVDEIFYPETVPEKECTVCQAEFYRNQEGQARLGASLDTETEYVRPDVPNPNLFPDDVEDFLKMPKDSYIKKEKPDDKANKSKDKNENANSNPLLND